MPRRFMGSAYEALVEQQARYLTHYVQRPGYRAWVKELDDGSLVGVGSAELMTVDEDETTQPPKSLVYVHLVAVQRQHQGRGHGAEMFDTVFVSMAHLHGPINAVWTVHQENARSRRMSESFGGALIDLGSLSEPDHLAYLVKLS